jgi:hypothetical protein
MLLSDECECESTSGNPRKPTRLLHALSKNAQKAREPIPRIRGRGQRDGTLPSLGYCSHVCVGADLIRKESFLFSVAPFHRKIGSIHRFQNPDCLCPTARSIQKKSNGEGKLDMQDPQGRGQKIPEKAVTSLGKIISLVVERRKMPRTLADRLLRPRVRPWPENLSVYLFSTCNLHHLSGKTRIKSTSARKFNRIIFETDFVVVR